MAIINNYSFLYTKPWKPIDESTELKIVWTLENYLRQTGDFKRLITPHRLRNTSEKFWRDFYFNTRSWSSFEWMIEDFLWMRSPLIVYYEGENVTNRIIDAIGPTRFVDNCELLTKIGTETIRRVFGTSSNWDWRTVAHAPKPDEVEEQLKILKKYNIT